MAQPHQWRAHRSQALDAMRTFNNKALAERREAAKKKADEPIVIVIHSAVQQSRCHKATAPWQPEEGSKAFRRKKEVKRPKFHWSGGDCVRVNYKRWTWAVRDNILEGDKFNEMNVSERCQQCDEQFKNA